ncbi:MAG: hypothetical protein ACR5LF_12755 [Symbiopectobacterium sp.]
MLTRLREIVEKVAAASRLNDALDLLVNETCQAMDTEVCSIYLADHDRQCYYLMATRGLKMLNSAVSVNALVPVRKKRVPPFSIFISIC